MHRHTGFKLKHWRWISLFAFVLCVAGLSVGIADTAPQIAPVEYRHLLDHGPLSIHVVSFDIDAPSLALTATVGKGVNGSETVSDMVAQYTGDKGRPLAMVNGDYFEFKTEPRYRGTLQGLTIANGELLSGPAATTFWLDGARQPHIVPVQSGFSLTWPGGNTTPFGLNCSPSDYESEVRSADVVLFTPSFGASTATTNVREIVLEQIPGNAWLPLRPNARLQAPVRAVRTSGNTTLGDGTLVISIAAKANANVPTVKPGDVIGINAALTPDLSQAVTAVAGDPLLLRDGQMATNFNDTTRHPRTAVGFAGRRCFLVVVDGCQPELSVGATRGELAAIMRRIGCTDALNLDGGGSSTLWWNGRVVNSPSDGAQRPVGNALVLMTRPTQPAAAAKQDANP